MDGNYEVCIFLLLKFSFYLIFRWIDLFPQATLVGLVHNDFFPNWFVTLYTWLSQSPKLDEVSRWYIGWKQQIPEPLVKV